MRVLVLSGGGSKGAFQLGVLDRLIDNEACRYDAVFGVSTGALTGSVIAQGSTVLEQRYFLNELIDLYENLGGNRAIYSGGTTLIGKLWNLWRHGGMYNPAPLKALIDKYVDVTRLDFSQTRLGVGYTDLESGLYCSASGHMRRIKEFILASALQPVFFQLPSTLGDGGCRNQTPLADAFEWIKTVSTPANILGGTLDIDVIVCNPVEQQPPRALDHKSASAVLLRTLDIIENEVFINDLRRALRNNAQPGKLCAYIRLYAPLDDLGDGLDFSSAMIEKCLEAGRRSQRNRLTKPQ